MAEQLKVGIAGLRRGSAFLGPLAAWRDTRVAAVCDTDRAVLEARRDEFGDAQVFTSYSEMLESGIDAVVVATPIHLHAPQSIEALERGIHVFSEVSAAISLQQGEDLVRAVQRSSAKYMMGENCCFMREFSVVRNMALAGVFGDVYYAEADYVHEFGSWARRGGWQDKWLLGRRGPTYITHPLGTVLNWLDDFAVTVSCMGTGPQVNPWRKNDDCSIMLCKTSKGALVQIRHDVVSPRPMTHNYAALQGTKGAYEAPRRRGDEHRVCLGVPDEEMTPGAREWRPLADFEDEHLPDEWRRAAGGEDDGHGGSDAVVMRAFVDSILNDTDPPIDVYRALDFTVPGLMAEASIRQGGAPVAVPNYRFM
jgi:predicted dehydrogenase